ncbi:MAG TPA: WhiB family transcriptional regulator [Candidatus Saccharimonadales bacterium]|nr:WhiB family transcriptional regulator [Candidatus Saccharimonadales bacterium]
MSSLAGAEAVAPFHDQANLRGAGGVSAWLQAPNPDQLPQDIPDATAVALRNLYRRQDDDPTPVEELLLQAGADIGNLPDYQDRLEACLLIAGFDRNAWQSMTPDVRSVVRKLRRIDHRRLVQTGALVIAVVVPPPEDFTVPEPLASVIPLAVPSAPKKSGKRAGATKTPPSKPEDGLEPDITGVVTERWPRATEAELAAVLGPVAVEEGDWQDDALCSQIGSEAFFLNRGESATDAKKICSLCEVQNDCLEYALGQADLFGIWGGLSKSERDQLRRERRKPKRRAA